MLVGIWMGIRRAGSLPLRGGQHDGDDNADDHDEYGTGNQFYQTKTDVGPSSEMSSNQENCDTFC
jgi:hypothetical protein